MSVRSLGTAASGIDTMQTDLDTIGNDIANSETDGFASQTAQFSDLLTEQLQPAGGAVGDTLASTNPSAVGVSVSVTGTWLPRESYIVVVMVTGLVALDGRFPPRTTFCVWAGGPVDPTTTLSGPGGDVVGWPGAHPSMSPPLLVARFPLLSTWRSPSSV